MPRKRDEYQQHYNLGFVEGHSNGYSNAVQNITTGVPHLQAAPTATELHIKNDPNLSRTQKDVRLHINGTERDPMTVNIYQLCQMNGHLSKDFEVKNYVSEQKQREEREEQNKQQREEREEQNKQQRKKSKKKMNGHLSKDFELNNYLSQPKEREEQKEQKSKRKVDDARTQRYWANQIRLGACKNCGLMGHDPKNCFERPSKFSKGT